MLAQSLGIIAWYLTSSNSMTPNSVRGGRPRATNQIINAATTIMAKPTCSTSELLGSGLPTAHDVFVAAGKNHAVSDGLIVSTESSPVGCAGFDAGAGDDMAKLAHWTSVPE